ncbi:hypothetical protein CLOLEP_01340 [[Clostridium] leptum DSM 753]|uniref:Uncharacterized protein n=1 Tax=[Clostridium] leptum DSM 753 TaxID=428125 RepID=A7VS03_9FIRM|nr:hypothetical protein CLOLEP_01340 [[Clostridium] leptum DSM 753]PEQ23859.1 hypothetical protein CH238_11950 [[Clostridium] leptum DSM 753]
MPSDMVSSRKELEENRLFKRRRPFFFVPPAETVSCFQSPCGLPSLCAKVRFRPYWKRRLFLFSKAWGFFILLKDIAKNGRAQPCALPFFRQVMAWQS